MAQSGQRQLVRLGSLIDRRGTVSGTIKAVSGELHVGYAFICTNKPAYNPRDPDSNRAAQLLWFDQT